MSDKTETPRTDALVEKHYQGPANSSLTLAMEQLARQLERELAEKALEVEELRGLLALAAQELPHCSGPVHERIRVYRQEHSRQIEKVEADNAALREDAERYRWLREHPAWETEAFLGDLTPEGYDHYVDAARARTE